MEPSPPSTRQGDVAAPLVGEAGQRAYGLPDDGARDATRPAASDCAALAAGDPAGSPAPDPLAPPAFGEDWWVLQTRSRCEKKLARACARFGVRHYLPLRPPRRRMRTGLRRRPARSGDPRVPLFPGYVFACCAPSQRDLLLESGAIARMIAVQYPAPLLAELEQIRAALAAGVDLAAGPALARGLRVRVASGLLSGVEGRVAGVRRDRVRLVLNVTLLGRSAEVEVDADTVVPVGAAVEAPVEGAAADRVGGPVAARASSHGDEASASYGGRRPWRVRRGRVIGQSFVGAV